MHIPYRGATQAALDVISNQVQVHFSAVSIVLPHINSGRMRALGVPSATRSPPEQVTLRTQAGLKRMSEIVKRAGIQAD